MSCAPVRPFAHLTRKPGGGYRIPLPNGKYRVTLFFAEGWFKESDNRVYDITLEDEFAIKGFDPAEAGFAIAHQESFNVELSDGVLDLEFHPVSDLPTINGICIERLAQKKNSPISGGLVSRYSKTTCSFGFPLRNKPSRVSVDPLSFVLTE